MAQNVMRAMRGMPLRVRSMEGLGLGLWTRRLDCEAILGSPFAQCKFRGSALVFVPAIKLTVASQQIFKPGVGATVMEVRLNGSVFVWEVLVDESEDEIATKFQVVRVGNRPVERRIVDVFWYLVFSVGEARCIEHLASLLRDVCGVLRGGASRHPVQRGLKIVERDGCRHG